MSTRAGGVSVAPWASLNLGGASGDDRDAVARNRRVFELQIGARPVWLRQVHGVNVLRLAASDAGATADAAWTSEPGVACSVLVADCLPVLFAERDGRAVAAAHAGWRGLAAGVLEATLRALQQGVGLAASDVVVWLGPCIGPRAFEVGADVLRAFGATPDDADPALFISRPRLDGSPRWRADLAGLARRRLQAAGVADIAVDGRCTVENASDFFSFRRDGVTGRLAAAVWRRG